MNVSESTAPGNGSETSQGLEAGALSLTEVVMQSVTYVSPTIGILLCTGKTGPTVRYALAGTRVPIAVADYQGLPEDARGVLPSAAELEAVIEDELDHRE